MDALASTLHFGDFGSIREAVKSCEVVLISAQWLLQRAGYHSSTTEVAGSAIGGNMNRPLQERKEVRYVLGPRPPVPLPCRQELELENSDAIVTLETLVKMHEKHAAVIGAVRAVPTQFGVDTSAIMNTGIISVSHCWYQPAHADPEAKTLAAIAAQLALDLPLLTTVGYDDAAVMLECALVLRAAQPHMLVPAAVSHARPVHR